MTLDSTFLQTASSSDKGKAVKSRYHVGATILANESVANRHNSRVLLVPVDHPKNRFGFRFFSYVDNDNQEFNRNSFPVCYLDNKWWQYQYHGTEDEFRLKVERPEVAQYDTFDPLYDESPDLQPLKETLEQENSYQDDKDEEELVKTQEPEDELSEKDETLDKTIRNTSIMSNTQTLTKGTETETEGQHDMSFVSFRTGRSGTAI